MDMNTSYTWVLENIDLSIDIEVDRYIRYEMLINP